MRLHCSHGLLLLLVVVAGRQASIGDVYSRASIKQTNPQIDTITFELMPVAGNMAASCPSQITGRPCVNCAEDCHTT